MDIVQWIKNLLALFTNDRMVFIMFCIAVYFRCENIVPLLTGAIVVATASYLFIWRWGNEVLRSHNVPILKLFIIPRIFNQLYSNEANILLQYIEHERNVLWMDTRTASNIFRLWQRGIFIREYMGTVPDDMEIPYTINDNFYDYCINHIEQLRLIAQ